MLIDAISFINHTFTWENYEVTRSIETTTPENNNILFPTASEVNNTATTTASLESARLCPGGWTRIEEGCYQFVTEEWVSLRFIDELLLLTWSPSNQAMERDDFIITY